MNDEDKKARIENRDLKDNEWPKEVYESFDALAVQSRAHGFDLIAGVGVNMKTMTLTMMLSETAAQNPNLPSMCKTIADFFRLLGERHSQ